ncbi:MAG TPA: thiamine pyrophosphate-dependent enzyme, partial [Candidatus Obscuribacter sp.]|nr:thiamine pyrophosphate-dependent enzyme [Candidatus Obscuribacter sp.]
GSIIVNDILSIHADPCSVMSLETSSSYVSSNACIDGYGLPAGLGVQLSLTAQELPVIVLTSDESIMQCSEALWSVAHYQLPIKIVIVSAGGAALLIQPQTPAQIGFPFNSPTIDFQKMGQAMGLKVFTATIMEEMEEAITRLFEEEGPCVLNVKVSG